MKKLIFLCLFLLCAGLSRAQVTERILVLTSDPTGACPDGRQAVNITSTTFFYCAASTWHSTSGGTSGTTQTIYSQNGVISGCGVSWAGNLVFTVSACTYVIAGVQYTSSLTNVTLETADVTNPRIDAIIVNTSSAATYIKGNADVSPALPTVDPTTQLGLSFVWVAAGATTPTNFTDTDLYLENTEWTCTASTNVNCASTTNPYAGTKDIAFTSAVAGNNVTLVKPAAGTENLSTYQNLVVFIRSGATFPNAKSLTLTWLNGVTQVGSGITVKDGLFGFSSATTATYQQLTIPTSSWGTGASLVTTLKIAVTGGSSAISFRLDNIKLQGGGNTSNISFMNFKQTYSAASVYSPNDVVIYSGASYVAILTNTNILPTNTTYWTKIGVQSAGAGTVTSSGYTSGTPVSAFSSATNITPATSSDVIALFSTCSGTQYLGADGACHTASSGATDITTHLIIQENFCSAQSAVQNAFVYDQAGWVATAGGQVVSVGAAVSSSYPCSWNIDSFNTLNSGETLTIGISTTTSGQVVNPTTQNFKLVGIVANAQAAAGRGVIRFGAFTNFGGSISNNAANIYFEMPDGSGAADQNWFCKQTKTTGGGTDVADSGVVATHSDGSLHPVVLEIDGTASATTATWKINGSVVCAGLASTHYPNAYMAPGFGTMNPTGNDADRGKMNMFGFSLDITR